MTSDKAKGATAGEKGYAYQKIIATHYIFQLLKGNQYLSIQYQDNDSTVDDVVISFASLEKRYFQCKKNGDEPDGHFSKGKKEEILMDMYKQYLEDTNFFLNETNNKYFLISQNKSILIYDIISAIKKAKATNESIPNELSSLNNVAQTLYNSVFIKLNNKEFEKIKYESKENVLINEKIVESISVPLSEEKYRDFWLHVDCKSIDESVLNYGSNLHIFETLGSKEDKYNLLCESIIGKLNPVGTSSRYATTIKKKDLEDLILLITKQ